MKTTKTLALFFLTAPLLFLGCDPGDAPDEPYGEEIHIGGEVSTSQLITIQPGGHLTQESYNILLDDVQLTAHRISDTQLAFLMPAELGPGDHFVKIPALDNHTIHYSVVETVLPQAPEAVMAPFFEQYETVAAATALPGENHAQAYLDALVEAFGDLSPEGQRTMATYYYANRELFNGVLAESAADKGAILFKYSVAVLAMGASVVIAWTDPEPISKSVFILAAILTFQKAEKLYHQFADEEIVAMEGRLDAISSEFEKAPRGGKFEGGLEFSDGKAREISIGLSFRRPIASDATAPTGGLVDFFASTSLFNGGIDKLNAAIAFVNEHLFLSDIPLIQKNVLPEKSAAVEVAMTQELFDNISFSVSGAHVALESLELTPGMNLNIGLRINNPTETEDPYVEGSLNLAYSDAFNGGSTSIPIRVNKAGLLLVGDLDFGEVAIGETRERTLTLANTSEREINISGISLPNGFRADWDFGILPALGSQLVMVTFAPTEDVEYKGDLVVANDVDDRNNSLPVSGVAITNPYFGTWTAISFHGQPMNTYIVDAADISCGTPNFEYAMERFSITLDATTLALQYSEHSRNYLYTYDSEESCATRTLDEIVPYSHSLDQSVPYAFDGSNADRILYEMTVDGEVLSMAMVFALQGNGNLSMMMTHLEDGETHTFELERR